MCKQKKKPCVIKMPPGYNPIVQGQHPTPTGGLTPRMGWQWQSNDDFADRRRMLSYIQQHLTRNISARADVNELLSKLPSVSRAMEVLLYHSARTRQEYLDLSTLQDRLHMIKEAVDSTEAM